jgi:hydroxymethylpyrimidine pyrophosphatase-like HAD family hydrolase
MNTKPKTIICDIDGVILKHKNSGLSSQLSTATPPICSEVTDKFNEWDAKGYNIILITGRRESHREETIKTLKKYGLFFDHLIMGVGGGDRVLINDKKPDSQRDTAIAINLNRNEGIQNVEL